MYSNVCVYCMLSGVVCLRLRNNQLNGVQIMTLCVATTRCSSLCPPHPRVNITHQSLLSAVSGPTPSVCTCVFVQLTLGQQISGRECWQTGKAWHKSSHSVNHTCTHTPHLLQHGAHVLLLPSLWVFVWVLRLRLCGSRWWWSAYLCVGEITGWLGR